MVGEGLIDYSMIRLGKIVNKTGVPHMLFTNGRIYDINIGAIECKRIVNSGGGVRLQYVCWPRSELADKVRYIEEVDDGGKRNITRNQ